jgi:hypothetical protein
MDLKCRVSQIGPDDPRRAARARRRDRQRRALDEGDATVVTDAVETPATVADALAERNLFGAT